MCICVDIYIYICIFMIIGGGIVWWLTVQTQYLLGFEFCTIGCTIYLLVTLGKSITFPNTVPSITKCC